MEPVSAQCPSLALPALGLLYHSPAGSSLAPVQHLLGLALTLPEQLWEPNLGLALCAQPLCLRYSDIKGD